jgi:citrate synthase
MGKLPTLAAYAYRHRRGLPYVYPDNELSYAGNFLSMMFRMVEKQYVPNPAVERALDVLLHPPRGPRAELLGDGDAGRRQLPRRPLQRPRGGLRGALRAAARRRQRGGHPDAAGDRLGGEHPELHQARQGQDKSVRLMGFGHRVYKNYDPRAMVIKGLAYEVFDAVGKNPLIDIAVELERIALEDEYFVNKKLYPNVDFYSGLIYQAMGLPMDMYPVLFALGRSAGWLAQWDELLKDDEQRIARPRQIYLGHGERDYVGLEQR